MKAMIAREEYVAGGGQWHQASVTFKGNQATIVVDRQSYTVTSERFVESIEKSGVGHFAGTLESRQLKIKRTM
ncbi:MAG: hypothetical protein GY903_09875 [Fuerstiella sp.]|nr:hypothetical protein [Fuerstiella sp.]MCP4854788.1 hypothetical protein [Fuerstiella sp.]